MKKTNKKGFTLVEIMIVVAIIGLLAAIGIPSFQNARTNTIDKNKQNNARILAGAVDEWAMANGLENTATVTQGDIVGYIKGGWAGLTVGAVAATFPASPGDTVGYYSTNVATIADAMY